MNSTYILILLYIVELRSYSSIKHIWNPLLHIKKQKFEINVTKIIILGSFICDYYK